MERPRCGRASALVAIFLGLTEAGCSSLAAGTRFSPERLETEEGWVAARGVPMVRQRGGEDCGAAAVAMVLSYWGRPVAPDRVTAACPPAPGVGIRAGALRDYVRGQGLQAFLVAGRPDDLAGELSRRRPVLVGTMLRESDGTRAHYQVVVALHPEKRLLVSLDPARGWRETTVEEFLSEWEPSGRLMLVVFATEPTRTSRTFTSKEVTSDDETKGDGDRSHTRHPLR